MPEAPEKRDLDQARARLTSWLAKQWPQAHDLRLENLRAPSDTGFSSETLMLEAHFRQDGEPREERLVARIEPQGFNVFPSYDLTVQYRVMDALAETDVPVPRMRACDWTGATLGSPFYLMEQMDGWVPSDNPPMHGPGRIADELSPADREAFWWSGLEALCRVHSVDPIALGLGFLDEPERGADPLEQHLRYYDDFIDWGIGDLARYPRIGRALGWLRSARPKDEPVGLCWGDSRVANQIFSGTECIAVIDWEMVRLGNPLQDLAWWVATDRCFTEGIGLERLEGFPSRDATAARWAERTGGSLAHLDYYEVFALMRFSVIMARLGHQMKHYGILPEDHEMDVENLASATLGRKLDEVGA